MHLVRKYLEIASGLSVEELRLLAGSIRVKGAFDQEVLKIGFFETPEMRVLGNRIVNGVVAVAYGGARFDSAGSFPAIALTLNFSPALAGRVVSESAASRLLTRLTGSTGVETLIYPITPQAAALKENLRRLLSQAEDGGTDAADRAADEIVAASAGLIKHMLAVDLQIPGMSVGRRRVLALAVEDLLWEPPSADGVRKLSLDEASMRLESSRRSIQLALHEEFGMGFVALKRAIRLQQAHAVIKKAPHRGIGEIARAHEFFHLGRFSRHYQEMFGVLPSTEPGVSAGV